MIRIVFAINRELIHFVIIDKYIYYTDRKMNNIYIRCLPKPTKVLKKNNKIYNKMFEFTREELEEYDKCETEEDISKSVIKDANLKGCRLIIKKEIENNQTVIDEIKDKEFIQLDDINKL